MSQDMNKIKTMLFKAERYNDEINIIKEAIDELREVGGKVEISVYTNSGNKNCKHELTENSSMQCLKVVINEYNDLIREINKEINGLMDKMVIYD